MRTKLQRLPPLPSIRDVVRVFRLKAMRQLSQNFLLDMNLSRKIVKAAGDLTDGYVCEVGPGPGGITRAILEHDIKHLLVVEKDWRFLDSLKLLEEAAEGRLSVDQGDILQYDLGRKFPDSVRKNWLDESPPVHIIGNLPFSVSTPLIIRWLSEISYRRGPFSYGRTKLTLTFQKEVAERMVAPILGPQRCRLSIMCQFLAKVEHKFTIPGQAFKPPPEVDVGVVRFEPLPVPKIRLPFETVEKFCRHIFHYRRKYCVSGVRTLFPPDLELEMADEIFRRSRVNPKVTCMHLSIEEISDMCNVYDEICRRIPGLYHFYYRNPVPLEELEKLEFPFPPKYPFSDELSEKL